MEAEFVTGQPDSRWPRYAHKECRAKNANPKVRSNWKEFMMNNFFHGIRCNYCGEKLQCSCSQFKVTTPETGKCPHE